VNIKTKSFPEQFSLTFSTSAGFNSQNNFNNEFLTHQGGSTDYWGFDDGGRSRPADVLDDPSVIRTFDLDSNLPVLARINLDDEGEALATAADAAINSVNSQFTPTEKTSTFDHSYGITFGNQYNIGNNALGVIASASFKKKFENLPDYVRRNWSARDINAEELFNEGDFIETLSDNIILPDIVQGRELFFVEREMRNVQLGGSHAIPSASNLLIEWKLSRANSSLTDPDRRFFENEFNTESGEFRIILQNFDIKSKKIQDLLIHSMEILIFFLEMRTLELLANLNRLVDLY